MTKGNPTLEKYKQNLSKDLTSFTDELSVKFPDLRLTSGFRKGAKTAQGNVSHHSSGNAIDIEDNKEVYDYLYNTKDGISLLNKYKLGVIDETTPEMMAKTGATGRHYHIGTDSHYVTQAKNRYRELVGEQQIESITSTLNLLPTSNVNTNFASVPDAEISEENETENEEQFQEDKDVQELKQQTAEQNFLEELKNSGNKEQVVLEQPQNEVSQRQQAPKTDYNQVFDQVNQFVEGDMLAQQGGEKKSIINNTTPALKKINNLNEEQTKDIVTDKNWLDNWLSKRVIGRNSLPTNFKKPNIEKVYVDELNTNDYGYYDTVSDFTVLDSVKFGKKPNIGTHELTHQVQNKNPYYKSLIEQPITKHLTSNSYTSQPEEIHSELMRLRQAEGYEPNKEVSKEQVSKIKNINSYNLKDLNEEQLLDVLNSTASLEKKANYYGQQGAKQNYTENELSFLSEIAIKDNQGQYNHAGKITEIASPLITMKNVNYDVLGISKETGEKKLMKPNKEYDFGKKTQNVIEIPFYKNK